MVDQLGQHFNETRRWLLAPVAGLSILTLIATLLNHLGLPTKVFGPALFGALFLASLGYCLIRRPTLDIRRATIWGAGLATVLLVVGWPLLIAGTDWVSFGNGDMGSYLLGANHLFAHGFFEIPSPHEFFSDADPSWDGSFEYSMGGVRSASQLVLALTMAVTRLTAAEAYMVLIVALHVVVLSTTAALVCARRERERVAFLAMLTVGSSANFVLGTLLQLMPQDFGLACLGAAAIVLLDRPRAGLTLTFQAALAAIFVATLLLAYPELSPFLLASLAFYAVFGMARHVVKAGHFAVLIGALTVIATVLVNSSLPGAIHYLVAILRYSSSPAIGASLNAIFPYYLTPFGFSVGWGLRSIDQATDSSWQSQAYIVVGVLLFVVTLVVAVRMALRLEPVAIVATTMLAVLVLLFRENGGFGLFKLAMYAQPFVLSTLAIAIGKLVGWPGPEARAEKS